MSQVRPGNDRPRPSDFHLRRNRARAASRLTSVGSPPTQRRAWASSRLTWVGFPTPHLGRIPHHLGRISTAIVCRTIHRLMRTQ